MENSYFIDKYLDTLAEKISYNEEYRNLAVTSTLEEIIESDSLDVNVVSNAGISFPGSYSAQQEIIKTFKTTLYEAKYTGTIKIRITFSKRKGKKEEPTNELLSKFYCTNPKYSLDDVVLPQEKLDEIQNALSLIKNHDLIFEEWGWKEKEPSAKSILCFYGKPGTGKTMCAHGIAKHINKQILIASYADIQSEFVGVGPKNLKAVFAQAEAEDAVLFFDEADSFLRKRTSDTSSSASMHYNSMTNEMMKHLEDFNGLVIFATNLTENTDEAFKTRITSSIEFTVPDEATRAKLISFMIPAKAPLGKVFSDEDYLEIANSCDGFVGRDIRNAVKYVLTEGARTKSYPFSVESFVEGFNHYSELKKQLDESINGKKSNIQSPLDLYSETNCVLALTTYGAWFDGNETDEESEVLKDKAKLLSRNKLIIGKLSDLPNLQEICEGIKQWEMRKTAMLFLIDILLASGEDDSNIAFLKDIATKLSFENPLVEAFLTHYWLEKNAKSNINQIVEQITEVKKSESQQES